MNARDTLLFCAYNNFTIPHDIVGAILFGDALAGQVEQIKALWDVNMFGPSLYTFIADADWYLAAIKSMGYPDIVEEFERINREYHEYARNYHPDNHDNLEPLIQELESLIPSRYMDIIKKCQEKKKLSPCVVDWHKGVLFLQYLKGWKLVSPSKGSSSINVTESLFVRNKSRRDQ